MQFDIVVDLQYGDTGKGKITHYLCKTRDYTHVLRYNGGGNAGHTIFHNGKKFVTHQVPAGVFFGIKSIIGPGCVIDPETFLKELNDLEEFGVSTKGLIFISSNTHVVTASHKEEDGKESGIGTTKRGIGPAYKDKYSRVGIRANEVDSLKPYLIDIYNEWKNNPSAKILGEGAQGFGLDIDFGDYPFVTSSHCTSAGALLSGLPPQSVKEIWGVAKAYETYVGAKKFEPSDKIFEKIRELGGEFGATTGRPRQCNWMNIDLLEKAIRINGVTHIVFNKMDILAKVNSWKIIEGEKTHSFENVEEFKKFLVGKLDGLGIKEKDIYFSSDKERI